MPKDSYASSVRHAADITGSYEALAAHIGVDVELVNNWAAGTKVPTATHFSRIVDIIVGKSSAKPAPRKT
jgi:DNA-binding transcriptional regulator YdaS (Cro superfamily)